MSTNWKTAPIIGVAAVVLMLFLRSAKDPPAFAFDASLPDFPNGAAYKFAVVQPDSDPLASLEARLLERLNMSPAFRCGSGLYGKEWIGKSPFSLRGLLLRLYKLELEEADPPSPDRFVIRHRVLGIKTAMSRRHDEFTCKKKKRGGGGPHGVLCEEWDSVGYVAPWITKVITGGKSSASEYRQKLVMSAGDEADLECPVF